jgi:hypothetical protein
MRNVINTIANVTTTAIVNRTVRTVVAGVDVAGALPSRALRLYAAPAPQHWDHVQGQKPFAGKKPADMGPMSGGGSERLSRSRCLSRESSRCRRPRVLSCCERS